MATMREEVPAPGAPAASGDPDYAGSGRAPDARALAGYLALGLLFGVTLVRGEVVSWFRMQEMFRLQGFHMYGVMLSAIAVAMPSLWLIRRLGLRSLEGEPITVPPKTFGRGTRYWLGSGIFGVGWALAGACPGPLFALVGPSRGVMAVGVLSAVAGTWVYGWLRPRLPH